MFPASILQIYGDRSSLLAALMAPGWSGNSRSLTGTKPLLAPQLDHEPIVGLEVEPGGELQPLVALLLAAHIAALARVSRAHSPTLGAPMPTWSWISLERSSL